MCEVIPINEKPYITKDDILFAKEHSISPFLAALIRVRGRDLKTLTFIDKPSKITSPFKLRNLKNSVYTIHRHIKAGNTIAFYTDYDVDGVVSAVLLYNFFTRFYDKKNVLVYIPEREEGYGLNRQGIDKLVQRGVKLLITADCGVTQKDMVAYAKGRGLDVIVTDHHNADKSELPDCLVVNPKIDNSGLEYLCGAGVVWQVLRGYNLLFDVLDEYVLYDMLDLVALATVADMVSLVGDNRIIVKHGLKVINNAEKYDCSNKGIRMLIDAMGLYRNGYKWVSEGDLGYYLGPAINACGRVGSPKIAFLGLADVFEGYKRAKYVGEMIKYNEQRKQVEDEIYRDIKQIILGGIGAGAFIHYNGNYDAGVIGIVAGRVMQDIHRPVIIFTDDKEDFIKGSARSISGVDLYSLLCDLSVEYPDILPGENFGGHTYAAGLSIKRENFEKFRDIFNRMLLKKYSADVFEKVIKYDLVLGVDSITLDLVKDLEKLAPFGMDNPRPVFLINPQGVGDIVIQEMKNRSGKWCRINLHGNENSIDAVYFDIDETDIDKFDLVVGTINVNVFNGIKKPQVIVKTLIQGF